MHQNNPGLWLRSPGAEGCWYEMPFRQDVFTVILGVSASLGLRRNLGGWVRSVATLFDEMPDDMGHEAKSGERISSSGVVGVVGVVESTILYST